MNRAEGKNGNPNKYPVPTPIGLLIFMIGKADHRTGIFNWTNKKVAKYWGCHKRSISRIRGLLIDRGHLLPLYKNRPDVFILKFERWDVRLKAWVRVPPPKIAKSAQRDKAAQTHKAGQIDKAVKADGQGSLSAKSDVSGRIDTPVHANSDKSPEDKESQPSNKLIGNKEIKNNVMSDSLSKPLKPDDIGPGRRDFRKAIEKLGQEIEEEAAKQR
jgi:hypothetical protein